jgi:addiction module HigA family antidote
MSKPADRLRPVHPGEVLREDFLAPLGLSVNALAMALGVPSTRIHEIVKERRTVTADTALRLAQYFGGDAASWLALQANYDLKTLPTRAEIAKRVPHRSLTVA